jgi:hypothetical protein
MNNTFIKSCFIAFNLIAMPFVNRYSHAATIVLDNSVFNPTDVTTVVVNAINSQVDTVIIKNTGRPWNIRPTTIWNKNNFTLILEPGVAIQAKSGAFTGSDDCLFQFKVCSNITILGYGASFQMIKSEYTSGEWRHAIALYNCSHFDIKGLLVKDSGGDGLQLYGYLDWSPLNYCEYIKIIDCVFDNNRRQGCSIISARNVWFDNCTFSNTKGTLPEAGVDIEPEGGDEYAENINFNKCRFVNNHGHGLDFGFYQMQSTSTSVSVNVNDCYFSYNHDVSNAYTPAEIVFSSSATSPVGGQITFNRCFVDGSNWSVLATSNSSDDMNITMNDCVFKNVSQVEQNYNNPFWIEVPDYSIPSNYFGGLEISNCLLTYNTNLPFAHINGWSNFKGVKNVNMSLTVVHPTLNSSANNSAYFSNVLTQVGVQMNVSYLNSLPAKSLTLQNLDQTPLAKSNCNTKTISLTSPVSHPFPLALNYSIAGTATNRIDYHQLQGFMLLMPNATQRLDTLVAINPHINPNPLTVELNPINNNGDILATSNRFTTQILPFCPDITDRTDPIGTGRITARGDYATAGEGKDKAFDNDAMTKWLDFSAQSWIGFRFDNSARYAVNKYTITSANDEPERDPRDWKLYGTNATSPVFPRDYTEVGSQSNVTFNRRYQKKEFAVSNSTEYRAYRLVIRANRSAGTTNPINIIQLAEIELFAPLCSTCRVASAEAQQGLETESLTLQLHPNPTSQEVSLSLVGFEEESVVQVRISGLGGTSVLQRQVQPRLAGKQVTLSVAHLPQGLYVVTLQGSRTAKTAKLILTK